MLCGMTNPTPNQTRTTSLSIYFLPSIPQTLLTPLVHRAKSITNTTQFWRPCCFHPRIWAIYTTNETYLLNLFFCIHKHIRPAFGFSSLSHTHSLSPSSLLPIVRHNGSNYGGMTREVYNKNTQLITPMGCGALHEVTTSRADARWLC
jgi:hypothetical protein